MASNMGNRVSLVEEQLADFDARLAISDERAEALNVASLTDVFKDDLKTLNEELSLVKRALSNSLGMLESTRVKVPEPNPFGSARVAKELNNFTLDMEQYFTVAHARERDRVTVTSMEALRILKHTATVREYVKQFSSLMLNIKIMSEEDKLLNFMAGLQPWAQAELRRQGVKDLPAAVTAAESLVDFKLNALSKGSRQAKGKGKGKRAMATRNSKVAGQQVDDPQ
ncbi:hypothetical protein AMTR_s00056p00222760 [Amborella trichopoda]|uniref:Retrotransposon gag domain-containing protein n=1 Tax=Amborella trichopoda TaxID=13333 RepID=U5CYM2_AMBTC|nr:hypothetical protein AMTR_s00056p00222760 [Amborella trichopoda]